MRGLVYNNKELAGFLEKDSSGRYVYRYVDSYFLDRTKPPISLSFPKSKQEYYSEKLFPFFYGLLSEGVNKDVQCRLLKLDEKDHFRRLLITANHDTIGSITVKPDSDELSGLL